VAAASVLLAAGCSGEPPASGSTAPSPSTSSAPATTIPSPTPSAPSVSEVFRDARTASLSAESGHVVGTVTSDGAQLRIDLEGRANGSNQTVFITTPKGGTAEVLTVGDGWWVGGDEAHWVEITGDPKAATALVGKYAAVTESDATELGSFTLRTILTDAFAQPELAVLESDTGAAAETEVDGRPAYVVGPPEGPRLWVAADGSGTLLRLVGPKSDPSDLTFSDWGRARTFTEPPPDEVVEN
jgi:dipeptidyl aminopeptidase/acylaminoacyl peptidase